MTREVNRRWGPDGLRGALRAGRALAGDGTALARSVLALREEFEATDRFAGAAGAHISLEDLERVLRIAVDTTAAGAGALCVVDEDHDTLVVVCAAGAPGRPVPVSPDPVRAGIRGWAYEHRRVAAVADFASDRRCRGAVDRGAEGRIRNLLVAPVAVHGRRLGLLEIANKRHGHAFTVTDEAFAALFARLAWHLLRAFERQETADITA